MPRKPSSICVVTLIFLLLFVSSSVAQDRNLWSDKKCTTPAYAASEVTRRAKIYQPPNFTGVREAFSKFHGRVTVDAVLCRSGQVTDIRVIEGSSPTVNEFVSAVVSEIRFLPAELNLHSVSQKIRFDFEIDEGQVREIKPPQTNGRVVESVNVIGNRRFTAKQIFTLIKTRAGEPYDEAQVQLDLKTLLGTGQFDEIRTRVFTEDGVRGGVDIYFRIEELPLIGSVTFEGLKIDPAVVRDAWQVAQINLRTAAPYTPEAGNAAIGIIKQVLDSKALAYKTVELRTELSGFQTVNLIFVITNQ